MPAHNQQQQQQNFYAKGSSSSSPSAYAPSGPAFKRQQQQQQLSRMHSNSLSPNDQYNLSYNQRQMSAQNRQLTGTDSVYSTTTQHEQRVTTSRSPDYSTTSATYLNLPSTSGRCDSQQSTSANQEAIIRRGEIIEPGDRVIRWSSVERCAISPSADYQVQVVQPLNSTVTTNQQHQDFYRAGSYNDAHSVSARDGRYCSESVTTLDGGDSVTLVILNCSPSQAGGDSICGQTSSRANSSSRASELRDCYNCQSELTIRHEIVPIDHSICQQHQYLQRNYLPSSPVDAGRNTAPTTTEIEEVTTTTTSEETERLRRDQRHTQHEHYQQWLSDRDKTRNKSDNNNEQRIQYHPPPRQESRQQQQQSQLTYEQIERSYEKQMREFENEIEQSYITGPKRHYPTPTTTATRYTDQYSGKQSSPAFKNPNYYEEDPAMPLRTSAKPSQQNAPAKQQRQQQDPSTSKQQEPEDQTAVRSKASTRLIKRWDFNKQQFVYTEVPEEKWKNSPASTSKQAIEKEPEPVWTQHRVPDVESVQSDPLYSDLMMELQRLEEGAQVKPEPVIVEPESFQKPIFGQKILPEHAEVNEYENAEFVCRLIPISDPQMKVEWSVNGRPLPEGSRYTSEYEFGVVRLRIKRCEAEDSGIYQCKASNAMGEATATASLRVNAKGLVQCETLHPAGLDKIRQLENPKPVEHIEEQPVQQPPKFLTHITDYVEKDEGDSVHFECCLGPVEDPDLKTEWFFNGRPLVTGSRFHTIDDFGFIVLDIDWLFPRDTGEYVCRATNKYGTDLTRTVLRVRPAKNIVLDSQLDNSDQVIDKLRRLEFPDVEQEVYVEEPDKPAHFVQQLRSEANRRQFAEGDNVHFEARVGPATDGNLTVEWYHNDKPLISGHRFKPTFDFGHIQLDILYVYPEDSGVYKCIAKNATGTDVSQFEINVTGKPSLVYQSQLPKEMEGGVQKITEMEAMWNRAPDPEEEEAPAEKMAPQFVLKPKPYTAFEGSCARFCCRVVGVPRPRLTWTLNGQNVVSGSRHKLTYDGMYHLTIPKCQLSDAGKVEVYARNLLGECFCATELNVKRKVDDYRGVLKNSPNPWYDEQSLKVYQRQRSQDLTDDEDFCTFQANRLQADNQVVGYMEPDTPDVNLLAPTKQAPLIPPGDLHPMAAERQIVLTPAPSTIQKALYVKDTIKTPDNHIKLTNPRKKQSDQQQQPDTELVEELDQPVELVADQKKQAEEQPKKAKKPGLVFGLDLPRYTPQASTSGLQSPAVDGYRSKDVQQDYWAQQRFHQESHMARQNQLKLEHQKQQKIEQQQQMAQHQQYQREKQELREKQQQRQLEQKLAREQQELEQQQQAELRMAMAQQQQRQQEELKQKKAMDQERRQLEFQEQAAMYQNQQSMDFHHNKRQPQNQQQRVMQQQALDQQHIAFQQQAAAIQDAERARQQQKQQRTRGQQHQSVMQQASQLHQGQQVMQQDQQQQQQQQLLASASQQVFDPRLPPPPSPESKVHGKEVHFHTHKQTQKERLGENKEVLREIIDKEIFEQEHTGKTKDNVMRGSSVERGSVTPDRSIREHQQQQQQQREVIKEQKQRQQRQVRFQEEQEKREVLVEEYMIPPEFIQKIQPCRAIDGAEARFECTYIGDPKPTITWFRESIMIKPSNLYVIDTDAEHSKSSLVIRRVTVNANAVYTVKAENVAGSAKSSANLVVEPAAGGPQNQIEFLNRRSASPAGSRPSSSAGFLASSSSEQTSTVTTTTAASNLTGDAIGSGYLSDDQSTDSQKVVKSVRTRKLSAEQMASLISATSSSSLVPPTFLHTIHDVRSKPGELVRLDARLVGTQPMEVRWIKDGERLRADRSHKMVLEGDLYTLLILEFSQQDQGLYECLASNQVGEARCEAQVTLSLDEHTTAGRSSSAMGSRTPDDMSMASGGAFRSHSAASGSISQASNYSTSMAESSSNTTQKRHYGLQKHSYSPLMTQYTNQSSTGQQEIIPRLIKRLENQQVREGKSVTLRCQISSFPIVEVHWYKQGDKLIKPSKYFRIFKDNDETYCLKILETFPEDQGEYKCVAKAPNGQTHVETKAIITVIPNSPR